MLFSAKNAHELGRRYEPGEIVFRQGEPADCFYVILQGRVELAAEEKEIGWISMETLQKNDLFGVTSFFCQSSRVLTARCLEKTRLLAIDQKGFFQKVSDDPALAAHLLLKMAHSAHRYIDTIVALRKARLGI